MEAVADGADLPEQTVLNLDLSAQLRACLSQMSRVHREVTVGFLERASDRLLPDSGSCPGWWCSSAERSHPHTRPHIAPRAGGFAVGDRWFVGKVGLRHTT